MNDENELQFQEAAEADHIDQATEEPEGSQEQEEDTGRMLYADYTRKTQEVAEQRRELEARAAELESQREILAQIEAAREDPDAFDRLIDQMRDIRTQKFGPHKAPQADTENFTEGELTLFQMFQDMKKQLAGLTGTISSQVQQQQASLAAQNAVKVFAQESGIQVTADDVLKAVKETGISNPIHALKIANFGKTPTASPSQKPPTAGSKEPRELIVTAETREADILDAMAKGWVIKD